MSLTPADWIKALSGTQIGQRILADVYKARILASAPAKAAASIPRAIVNSVPASWVGGAGAGAAAAGALPVIGMVGVWVALGSGYHQAREIVKDENTQSGFSQGLVMGFLRWSWRHVVERFGMQYLLRINHFDGQTNVIRVEAYNSGLKAGYVAGRAALDDMIKGYLKRLRVLSGARASANWNELTQISYVVSLAAKARVHLIKK